MADAKLDFLARTIREKFDALDREQKLRDRALTIASDNILGKLETMNELRAQINSERGRYLERGMFDAAKEDSQKAMQTLDRRMSSLETRLTTIAGLGAFLIPVVFFIINYLTPPQPQPQPIILERPAPATSSLPTTTTTTQSPSR